MIIIPHSEVLIQVATDNLQQKDEATLGQVSRVAATLRACTKSYRPANRRAAAACIPSHDPSRNQKKLMKIIPI